MRVPLMIVAGLLVAVGLTLLAQQESGTVMVHYGQWSVETSFAFALLVLLVVFAVAYVLLRLLGNFLGMPGRMRAWRRNRRDLRTRLATQRGLSNLAAGYWVRAERDLARSAARSEAPLLNHLGAAFAAQQLGADQRRDHYLALAHAAGPDGKVAVGIMQAEMQISSGQLEQALAGLMYLYERYPRHVRVLQLLRQVYENLGSWQELLKLMPELRKRNAVHEEDALLLERRAWGHLLGQACEEGDLEVLRGLWRKIPRGQRQHVSLLAVYVRGLVLQNADDEAENLLREAIRRNWDNELVRLYGLVTGSDPARQLSTAEGWLKHHPHHPVLLLTLGRIAMRSELWGKARGYLEASAGLESRVETCYLLGELLEQMSEGESARDYYHRGLVLVAENARDQLALTQPRLPLLIRDATGPADESATAEDDGKAEEN